MNKFSYMHYRNHDSYGDIMPHGGTTVAILEQEEFTNQVLITVARCHDDDIYNKALGRKIAEGRITRYITDGRNIPVHSITIEPGFTVKESVDHWLQDEGRKYIRNR